MLQQHIGFEQTNDRAQQILGRINIVAKQWYDKDNNGNAQMRKVVSAVRNLCFIPQRTCIDIFTAIRIVQQTDV